MLKRLDFAYRRWLWRFGNSKEPKPFSAFMSTQMYGIAFGMLLGVFIAIVITGNNTVAGIVVAFVVGGLMVTWCGWECVRIAKKTGLYQQSYEYYKKYWHETNKKYGFEK